MVFYVENGNKDYLSNRNLIQMVGCLDIQYLFTLTTNKSRIFCGGYVDNCYPLY